MKRPRLRARDRRALVLGLVVITPFAVYRVAVEPWLSYRGGLHDALLAERDLLARERAVVGDAADAPGRAAELKTTLAEAQPWLLGGSDPVAASGRLTRIATDAAQTAGILVQEIRAADTETEGLALREISISLRLLGDLEGLARFLFRLENGERLLRIEGLSLRTAGVNDGDLEWGQLMNAGVVLVGYWQPGAGASESRPEGAEQ